MARFFDWFQLATLACWAGVALRRMVGLVVMLHRQILREEQFLTQTCGEAYRAYCTRVKRYITWPGTSKREGRDPADLARHGPAL